VAGGLRGSGSAITHLHVLAAAGNGERSQLPLSRIRIRFGVAFSCRLPCNGSL